MCQCAKYKYGLEWEKPYLESYKWEKSYLESLLEEKKKKKYFSK